MLSSHHYACLIPHVNACQDEASASADTILAGHDLTPVEVDQASSYIPLILLIVLDYPSLPPQ